MAAAADGYLCKMYAVHARKGKRMEGQPQHQVYRSGQTERETVIVIEQLSNAASLSLYGGIMIPNSLRTGKITGNFYNLRLLRKTSRHLLATKTIKITIGIP